MSFYSNLMSKKRLWSPTMGDKQPVMPGSEGAIGRCLALRVLEIPVGNWVMETGDKELAKLEPDAIALLQSNAEDEIKHDCLLEMATDTYQLTTKEMQEEADAIAAEWLQHPDHPIVKAFVLENSIFFIILPILRRFGGQGLRNAAFDISSDESIHAPCNRKVAKELGYSFSPSLDELRDRTVRFLVRDLNAPGKLGRPQVWFDASENLLHKGFAPQLEETKAYIMPAFFESHAADLPQYS
ncbi:hypothetical protein [Allocoleopsis sp.]|uniref:hypothetical protein n=1 Tax=Allocoleopsis sp. TaxID=3088169 RepID=UPI002FCF01ED